ncbi:MAG: mycothiol synthase [Actinomycetota bacterium]|nr:mycothiol synthase [Actinomycetota bacterium]MDQ2958081.1 mycothiol synthase [Actinomycetota bacterium]
MSSRIEEVATLSPELVEAVGRLVRSAPGAGDTPPISEQGMLRLTAGEPVKHLIVRDSGELLGYGQLDGASGNPTAELVAADTEVAGQLLRALLDAGRDGFRLWAHGADSVANQAALRSGLRPVRTLLQLRRGLVNAELAELALPAGVRIRAFVPGQDEQAWLSVNARAFAGHPEQGSWTQRDLDERLAAAWFDPAGFLLAERDSGELLGYHWTKVHSETEPPMGEVYVLGVDPSAQGLRLGTQLLNEGLRHLQARKLETVLLYVEESSGTAIHLYGRAGFTVFASDLQYAGR